MFLKFNKSILTAKLFYKNQSGSGTLQLLFSSAAGFALMLLMVDMSNFIRANGAVLDSATEAMRCLIPAEASCNSFQTGEINPTKRDWFGYKNESNSPLVYLQEVSYSPSAKVSTWQASLPHYSVPNSNIVASWPQYEIPVRRFLARLNSWQDTWAPVNRVWLVWADDPLSSKPTILKRFSYRLDGPLVYLPHGIEHGDHFNHDPLTEGSKVDAFTSEAWCLPTHRNNFPDLNFNEIPDEVDLFLETNPRAGLRLSSQCQLEHDDFTWIRKANCGWEGRPTIDQRYGTTASPFYNEVSRPLQTQTTVGGLQQIAEEPSKRRPQAIVGEPQFLAIEVVGCADGLEKYLNSKLRKHSEILTNFQWEASRSKIKSPWRESLVGLGYLSPGDESYIPSGAILKGSKNNSLISVADWTYLQLDLPPAGNETSGSTVSRELCSPWIELNDNAKNNPLFSKLFDPEYRSRLNLGKNFLTKPEAKKVGYTNLPCAKASPNSETFNCRISKVGCKAENLNEFCPNLTRHLQNFGEKPENWNSESTSGMSKSFWEDNSERIYPSSTKTQQQPIANQISFSSKPSGKVDAFSSHSCKQAIKNPDLILNLDPNEFTNCELAKNAGSPLESDWQSALAKNFPKFHGNLSNISALASATTTTRTFPINYPTPLPGGLKGTWLLQTNNVSSCEKIPKCEQRPEYSNEKDYLKALIEKQYGKNFKNCPISDLGREEGSLFLVENLKPKDACLPLITSCPPAEESPEAVAEFIASSTSIPTACLRQGDSPADYSSCYSVPITEEEQGQVKGEKVLIDLELAVQVGFEHLRNIMKTASLSSKPCGETEGCSKIKLAVTGEGEATAVISYNLKLGPALRTILGQKILTISHSKKEFVELARIGRGFGTVGRAVGY